MSGSLLAMAALLVASGTFSGAEAALFTLAGQTAAKPRPRTVRDLLDDQPGALVTILVVNLLANLAFFAAAAAWGRAHAPAALTLVSAAAVLAIVVFGEIVPKVLAHRFPARVGMRLLRPVWAAHALFGRRLGGVVGRFGMTPARTRPLRSEEARRILRTDEGGALPQEERALLDHVLELGRLRAGALRRPLDRIPRVPASLPLEQARARLRRARAGWAAVTDEHGEVVGLLDRTRAWSGATAGDAMRRAPVLPEVAPVANGIRLLREEGTPFVLLVDEYGNSAGVIERGRWADTLLDRLPDRIATARAPVQELADGRFLVDAALPLHEFEDRFAPVGEADARVDTIGGLVAARLERVARVGDYLRLEEGGGAVELWVAQCSETRPLQLEVCVRRRPGEGEES